MKAVGRDVSNFATAHGKRTRDRIANRGRRASEDHAVEIEKVDRWSVVRGQLSVVRRPSSIELSSAINHGQDATTDYARQTTTDHGLRTQL